MSDEFMKVASKEINEELDGIETILNSCQNDTDVNNNGSEIEKHLHKIKGLAPMMGQNGVGEIASLNDAIMKKIVGGKIVKGIYEILTESNQTMKNLMQGSTSGINQLKEKLQSKYSAL